LFKEFINKGNVVVGGAFGKIVSDRLRPARGCAARGAHDRLVVCRRRMNARAGATLSRESTVVVRPTFPTR